MRYRILVVDDDTLWIDSLRLLLDSREFEVTSTSDADEAVRLLQDNKGQFALAITDYHLGHVTGEVYIARLQQVDPSLNIVGISGDISILTHNLAMNAGATMFIQKDIHPEKLLGIVRSYCRKFEQTSRLVVYKGPSGEQAHKISRIHMIGRSALFAEVAEKVERFARQKEIVLILGENGTGKEKVAQAIHQLSAVAKGPFVAVNCAALPETLIESELFGYEKGAFTGAIQSKPGRFTQAHNGTIFLDEIGDMSPATQVRLLRVLQEREVTPVGGIRSHHVNARVIAATNVNLEKAVKEGRFRQDLYYRLAVLTLQLPPLRQRTEDIEPLVAYFCQRYNRDNQTDKAFLASTVRQMCTYSWPGNVRELEHEVTRLMTNTLDTHIDPKHLDPKFFATPTTPEGPRTYPEFQDYLDRQEKTFLKEQIGRHESLRAAAEAINVSKSTLQSRLKDLGIEVPRTFLFED